MKYLKTLHRMIIFMLPVLVIYFGCSQKPDVNIEEALNELKSYQFGDSRTALSNIETIIAQTTDEDYKKELASRLAEILETDASFATKQFICQQLRIIGNEKQIPLLTALLQEKELSDIALFALEPIQSPKVDQALRSTLPKLSGNAKIGIINAIGKRQDANAVTELALLLNTSDAEIAEAAALALGKIGTVEAGAEIKKALHAAHGKWAEKLGYCYLMCADNLLKKGDGDSALEIYRELSNQTDNKRIQMLARSGLVSLGHLQADDFVRRAIKEDDPVIRRLAVQTVIQIPGKEVTLDFCKLLPDLPSMSQTLLLLALSDRGDPQALQTVLSVISHKNKDVRIAALEAISQLGDETVVPTLMKTIVNSDGQEREAARGCLHQLKGTQVDQKIIQLMEDDRVVIRKESIKALAVRNAVEATPILLEMLDDPQRDIRIESWTALGELGSGSDLSRMISSWMNIQSIAEINIAEEAVVRVCRNENARKIATSDILAAIDKSDRHEIKVSLINALGRIGDEKALPQLRKQLNAKDHEIKAATIRSLSIWPTDEPLQDLRQVIATTEDEQQKVIALRGYIHLIGLGLNRGNIKTVELYQDAMGLAWRPEEKKLILAGYSQVHQIEALLAVDAYLLNKDLKNEAAAAALKISNELTEGELGPEDREKIVSSLDKIIENCEIESMRSEATETLKSLEE